MHTPVIRIQRKYFVNRIRDYQVSKCHASRQSIFHSSLQYNCCFFAAAAAATVKQQNNMNVELNTKWNLSLSIYECGCSFESLPLFCAFIFLYIPRTHAILLVFLSLLFFFFQIREAIWFDFLYRFWLGFGILNELKNNMCKSMVALN